jgi:hypothetical protein
MAVRLSALRAGRHLPRKMIPGTPVKRLEGLGQLNENPHNNSQATRRHRVPLMPLARNVIGYSFSLCSYFLSVKCEEGKKKRQSARQGRMYEAET